MLLRNNCWRIFQKLLARCVAKCQSWNVGPKYASKNTLRLFRKCNITFILRHGWINYTKTLKTVRILEKLSMNLWYFTSNLLSVSRLWQCTDNAKNYGQVLDACADCSSGDLILEKVLFVSKMDTYPDVAEHESSAKRIKLDLKESNIGELCNGGDFSSFSTTTGGAIDISEGKISKICLVVQGKFHIIQYGDLNKGDQQTFCRRGAFGSK